MICLVFPDIETKDVKHVKYEYCKDESQKCIGEIKLLNDIGKTVFLDYNVNIALDLRDNNLDFITIAPTEDIINKTLKRLESENKEAELEVDRLNFEYDLSLDDDLIKNNIIVQYKLSRAYDHWKFTRTALERYKLYIIDKKVFTEGPVDLGLKHFELYNTNLIDAHLDLMLDEVNAKNISSTEVFIWGKSDETNEPNLYTNNWIQVVYNKELKKYILDVNDKTYPHYSSKKDILNNFRTKTQLEEDYNS